MPTMVGPPKLKALGPFLFLTVYGTINRLGSFGSPSPVQFFTTVDGALQATPVSLTPSASNSPLHAPSPCGSAPRPMSIALPTPTALVEPGNDVRLLFMTWFTGLVLFLSVFVTVPGTYVLLSRLSSKARLRSLVPSLQQILSTIFVIAILHRWPELQEYPIDDICNAISYIWRGVLSRFTLENHNDTDIPKAVPIDVSLSDVMVQELNKEYARSEMASSRVVIVLEKRVDGSLWVIEFNHRASLEDASSEEINQTTRRLTTASGNEEGVTIDLADIKTQFTNAPKLIPSAPWRVVGFHQDPIEISLFNRYDIAKLSMRPLDHDHVAKHFAYSRSHDPGVENPFWDSSPTAQGLAWSLIISQSRIFSSSFGFECTGHGALYLSLGMEPYMDWLRWRISFEEKKAAWAKGDVPEWKQEAEERRKRHDENLGMMREKLRQHVEEMKEWAKQSKESKERHEALWRRATKKRKYRSSASVARWSAEGRLRGRRDA